MNGLLVHNISLVFPADRKCDFPVVISFMADEKHTIYEDLVEHDPNFFEENLTAGDLEGLEQNGDYIDLPMGYGRLIYHSAKI